MTRQSGGPNFLRSSGRVWALLSLVLIFVGLACASEGYGPGNDGSGGPLDDPSVGTPCEAESERACGLTLEVGGETMTCYRGTQTCESGLWSICRDGQVTRESLPGVGFDPAKRRVFADPAISDPAQCGNGQPSGGATGVGGAGVGGAGVGGAGVGGAGVGGGPRTDDFANPCDPGCMRFGENPTDINANGGASPGPPLNFPPRDCANSLCLVQGSIDETCDPCARKIVAKYPSCKANWTQQCVFWATMECAGVTPPTNVCDFALLSDGNLTISTQASANADIGAYGNVTIDASSTFGSVYAQGNVTISNLNQADLPMKAGGGIFSNGAISFGDSNNSNITGNIHAKTSVDLANVNIVGDVWAGTNVIVASGGGAKVSGHAYAGGTVPPAGTVGATLDIPAANRHPGYSFTPITVNLPPKVGGTAVPILPITCPNGSTNDYTASNSTDMIVVPGPATPTGSVNVRDIFAQNDGTIILRGEGTYYIRSLKIKGKLVLDSNGKVPTVGWDLRICAARTGDTTQTAMFEGSKIVGTGWTLPAPGVNDSNGVLLNPKWLTVFYAGTTTVAMGSDVYFTGIFMSPYATVTKSTVNSPPPLASILNGTRAAPVNGAIWAKELAVQPGAMTRAIPPGDCNAIDRLPIVSPPDCPLESGTRGLRNEPCTSGQDCQANSRCFRPQTGSGCAHSKCITGTPLSATCDDCVARICKASATAKCCNGSAWDQDCVNAVGTVCDAICQQGDCTQDPCVAGAQPIDKACQDNTGNGCVKKVCDVMSSCCTTAWTSACVAKMMEPGICGSISSQKRLCDLAVYAKNSFDGVPTSTVTGLTGTAASLDPDPSFSMSAGFFDCQPGTVSHGPANGNLSLTAGTRYNTIRMGSGTTLRFTQSGTYYMNELRTDGSNTLDFSGVDVDLVVCGKVEIGPDSQMTGLGATGSNPMRLRIYSNYNGNEAIWFVQPINVTSATSTRYGALYAPFGRIRIGQNIQHHGFAWGKDVWLVPPAALTYSSASETECKARHFDDGPVPGGSVCAIDLIPVPATETAKCVDNQSNYKDSSCTGTNGYDLALGTPCKTDSMNTEIPICNHGTVPFPPSGMTSVTVGYYAENLGQLAIDEPTVPLPSTGTGSCAQSFSSSSPIAPGTCKPMNCPIPPGRYTLMLDPSNPLPKQLNECDNRRLDNWSAADGRECIPFGQPKTVEYEYEAECPKDATARWGLLTWNTTTPGDSRVVFSLKAGADAAELAAAMYQEVGVARAFTDPLLDTQVCVFKDPTPCYADVSAKLSLGSNQGQKLSLKVDILPGTGSPVLRDWGISYSCIYDE